MLFSTSTWLVVVLVASAAMLASYLLSQWTLLRSNGRTLAWAGLSAGTLLLLTAAALVTLSMRSIALIHLPWAESLESYFIKPAEPQSHGAEEQPATTAQVADNREDNRTDDNARQASRLVSQEELARRTEAVALADAMGKVTDARPVAAAPSTRPATPSDPWTATGCVSLLHPDPADRPRTIVSNSCSGPVVVLFTSCPDSDCSAMILPSAAQRPVTAADETRRGTEIRYVACLVTLPAAVQLIGAPSEVRASDAWLAAMAVARQQDPCLARAP